jgi:CheY-like chemotaxis protein
MIVENTKIMVVDDDLPTLEVMELLLRKINREPLLVHNGWDALRMIKKEKPALIILDVMMSPIDGWQFLEELKRNEELKDIPVLLFTAKHVWPEEYSRYADDIVGVLEKPISLAELKTALEKVLPRDTSSHLNNDNPHYKPQVRTG